MYSTNVTYANERAGSPQSDSGLSYLSVEGHHRNGNATPPEGETTPMTGKETTPEGMEAEYEAEYGTDDESIGPPNSDEGHNPEVNDKEFCCVSANVQRSRDNTTMLLERYRDHDIVFVQEPFWGIIKRIPSAKNWGTLKGKTIQGDKLGEPYHEAVIHPNFIPVGNTEHSRVHQYVNRRWARHIPRTRHNIIKHNDVTCISLHVEDREIHFLNVYNGADNKFDALRELERTVQAGKMPEVAAMCGDFNTRHAMWDLGSETRTTSAHQRRGQRIIDLAQEGMNLKLVNDPINFPPGKMMSTWEPKRKDHTAGTLDLIWTHAEAQISALDINMFGRNRSDHAIMVWTTQTGLEPDRTPTILRDSEAAAKLVKQLRDMLETMPDQPYNSVNEVKA
jgi:hypothetical protein